MSNKTIAILDEDTDITLILPSKEHISLQYRVEGDFPSLDLCFEQKRTVYNWGRDMEPADSHFRGNKKAVKGEHDVFQLWIGLDPNTEVYTALPMEEKMNEVCQNNDASEALGKIADAIKNHDNTPTPTKNQWVRNAALQIACAAIQRTTDTHNTLTTKDLTPREYADMAVELAKEIWDRTAPK